MRQDYSLLYNELDRTFEQNITFGQLIYYYYCYFQGSVRFKILI